MPIRKIAMTGPISQAHPPAERLMNALLKRESFDMGNCKGRSAMHYRPMALGLDGDALRFWKNTRDDIVYVIQSYEDIIGWFDEEQGLWIVVDRTDRTKSSQLHVRILKEALRGINQVTARGQG